MKRAILFTLCLLAEGFLVDDNSFVTPCTMPGVDVLKGSGAAIYGSNAAVYGSNAANGVLD
ncbi:MAG: hypothetical protein CSA96_06055 [Bacteroidetes bacterium]|nr:MAG: hypothetical protein CSA96_06055 [Bacteroidota bacterium]